MALGLIRVHTSPDRRLVDEEGAHVGQIELRVPRGEIRDREGNLLAIDRQVSSLWVDPRKVKYAREAAQQLSQALGMYENELYDRITVNGSDATTRKFVWLKRCLTEPEVAAFNQLDKETAKGFALKSELVRYYPEGELAAHVIGFVNKAGVGSGGIEMTYDSHLRCVPGKKRSRVDAKRRVLDSLTLEHVEQRGGENLHLTIDKAIQRKLEQELDRGMIECKAPRAMGLVMDPKTGAILAMACRPAFDPNTYNTTEEILLKNRAVTDVFEPGSSFKIVTFAAALEKGLVTTETPMDCLGGRYTPFGHTITDFHKLGVAPISHCFAESSNIATIKLAIQLTESGLEEWVRKFGFGKPTGVDFPMESWGLVYPRSVWSRTTMGAIPIGQEIAVTMPQLARAFSVIANGGYLVEPHVVERAVDASGGISYLHEAPARMRVLNEATAKTMKELCHLVVVEGTGKPASIDEYRVGGKTGTAQIADLVNGGFYDDKYTAIFAGFAPISDPRLCAVIVVQEPDIKLHYGGHVCGPLFKNVVRDALVRMNCPLDPVVIPQKDDGSGEDLQRANLVEEDDSDTVTGRVAMESGDSPDMPPPLPASDSTDMLDGFELAEPERAPDAQGPVIADLRGMTKRQVKAYLDLLGVRWEAEGAGWVVRQDPLPGQPLKDVCWLEFSNQPSDTVTDGPVQVSQSPQM